MSVEIQGTIIPKNNGTFPVVTSDNINHIDGTKMSDVIDTHSDKIDNAITTLSKKVNKNDIIYLSDYFSTFDRLASCYYSADTALTNAINDCKSGGVLVIPAGQIFVTTTFNITKPITIIGGHGSRIEQSGYCDLFYVTCDSVHFINLELEHTAYWTTDNYATMRNGDYVGIRFQSGRRHLVDKCIIHGFSTQIHFVNCDFFSVTNSYINKCFNYGIVVENQSNPDSGDSLIHGNVFTEYVSTDYQAFAIIKQCSGGGLKISDNKILTGQIGIHIFIAQTIATSVLIITGNSIEGQTVNCFKMEYESGKTSGYFVRTIINNNEFLADNCTDDSFIIDGTIYPYSMKDILIQNNILAGTLNTLNCLNIKGVSDIRINGNELAGGLAGILIGAYVQNLKIHDNTISTASDAIKYVGYGGIDETNKASNIKHLSHYKFSNNSLYGAINTVKACFGSTLSISNFKLIIDIRGSIDTTANEQFYVHKEYLVYAAVNGSTFNSFTLLSSTTSGLPIYCEYDANGYVQIKRADTYADTTYTISGIIQATIDGLPCVIGGNSAN